MGLIWQENVGNLRFVDNHQFIWLVPSILIQEYSCVTSPMFSLDGRKLRLAKMHDGLYLWNEDRHLPYDECYVTLTIEGTDGQDAWSCKGETNLYYGFGEQFLDSHLNLFSEKIASEHNGFVKIFCKVERKESKPSEEDPLSSETENKLDKSSISEEEEKTKEIKVKGLEKLVQDFKNLLIDGQNSDVTLKAVDREFRVHTLILEARAPAFASMIQLKIKEDVGDIHGVVDIPDCTAESLEVFLLYLYTGSAERMTSDNVFNVYYAAEKYSVDDLKEECVQFIKNNMSVENIVDVIALSLKHNETGLLKDATNFFRQNIKKVIKTAKWKTYMKENSTHANELLVTALDAR